jgi:branched-chain amino acid transport system substrate-binding protein
LTDRNLIRGGFSMMAFLRVRVPWMISIVVLLLLIVGQNPAGAEDILKIGAIWGLSGPGSQVQAVMRDAAVLAVEWINNKGGIEVGGRKYKIELIVEDNKSTAQGCTNAATKLVHRDKVKFVTGMIVPFQFEAVQPITEPNQVILSTAKCAYLRPQNRYTFSSTQAFTAPYPGLYNSLLKRYPAVKKMGYIAADDPGALATIKFARSVAGRHGLALLEPLLVPYAAKDFYPVWTKLVSETPDAVDIGIMAPDSIGMDVRHGREIGFKGPIISVSTADAITLANLMGPEAATDFLFGGFDMNNPDNPPMVKEIMRLWKERYGRPFNLDGLDGWSSVWALTQAIEKAQSLDPNEVVKVWENMKTIETPWGTGTMGGAKTYGINHMVLAPAPISQLKKGKVDSTSWYMPDIP